METIAQLNNRLNQAKGGRDVLKSQIAKLQADLDKLHVAMDDHNQAREVIQKAAQMTQMALSTQLSDIVSQALELVFEGDGLGFKVDFVVKRNSTECEMYITEAGEDYDPLNSCGFGAADVVSFALRIAMWNINRTAPIMIFDEPFRNLDDERIPNAALLAATLSEQLDIQMIIVTHEDELKYAANAAFRVYKKDGISKIASVKVQDIEQ